MVIMKVVIIGAGSVGFQLAKNLIAEGKNVVLIEKDPKVASYANENLDCTVINNYGNNFEVLKNAKIHNADFFISVTNSDEVNMVSCAIASSEFNVKYKIARISNLEYFKIDDQKIFGIDFIINPQIEAVNKIYESVKYGASNIIMQFEKSDTQIRLFEVNKNPIFKNKTLKNIRKKIKDNFLIAAVLQNNKFIIPKGDTKILENDSIFIVANKNSSFLSKDSFSIKKILIIGGGKLGNLLCEKLSNLKLNLTIVEKNHEKTKYLAENYPNILVLNADITDESIYNNEDLSSFDLVISTTTNYELNILTALYLKNIGVKKAISIVENNNYLSIASKLGIDASISSKSSTVDSVLRFIRKGNLKSLYSVFEDMAEIAEYTIDSKSKIIDKALKDIKLPSNSLIISINRNNNTIIPNGEFIIKEADSIAVISEKKAVNKLENIFF